MNENKKSFDVTGWTVDIDNLTLSLFKYYVEKPENSVLGQFVNMHIHTHYELVACYLEKAYLVTPSYEVELSSGDVVLIPHDFPHTMKLVGQRRENWESLSFGCHKTDRTGVRDLWKRYKTVLSSKTPIVFRGVSDLCDRILPLLYTEEVDSVLSVLKLAVILEELFRRSYEKLAEVALCDGEPSKDTLCDDTRLAILNGIIYSQYTKNIDINRIATDLYVSRRHLDRIAKKRFGATIRDLINENRLTLACKLLLETDESIGKISASVGFSSKEAFHRAFVKRFCESPREYRNKITEKK